MGGADTAVARAREAVRTGGIPEIPQQADELGAEYTPFGPLSRRYPLIPWPRHVEPRRGAFTLDSGTRILLAPGAGNRLERAANRWAERVRSISGLPLPVMRTERAHNSGGHPNSVLLVQDPGLETEGGEAYRLDITPERILIAALQAVGIFYGMQTLRQLLPAHCEADSRLAGGPTASGVAISGPIGTRTSADPITIPAADIRDAPRFPYRGMHLDVGRHFFPVAFIKKYIDLLALHKCNRFHWHLTEDQGWRLEIKRYPRLTEVGSRRRETQVSGHEDPYVGDGEPHGGYYTQEQAREIVAYARDRFITVIPEVEMPGHSMAALAAYPELACTDGPFEVGTHWGIYEDIYSPGERTFEFLKDVLTEVMEIFPSEYIHVGGDEAPRARWAESELAQSIIHREGLAGEDELQSWFMGRIGAFLTDHGRRMIGWDEILEGGLPEGTTVMSWQGIEPGMKAARRGHDVIMTPEKRLYLDHYQGDPELEPRAIGGHTSLRDVYAYDPVPDGLTPEEAEHIIGAQANVWTEYMRTPEDVEYMAFPRALAFVELAWSPAALRDWREFLARLGPNLYRLELLDVKYRRPAAGDWRATELTAAESAR